MTRNEFMHIKITLVFRIEKETYALKPLLIENYMFISKLIT